LIPLRLIPLCLIPLRLIPRRLIQLAPAGTAEVHRSRIGEYRVLDAA
jgi:hypothetical protein